MVNLRSSTRVPQMTAHLSGVAVNALNVVIVSLPMKDDNIERELRSNPRNEITSKELGDLTLSYLADLDEVAYIRFASVYKDFQNIEEFSNALHNIHR